MLPIRDNVPTRTFPVVTVTLIAINVAVWLLYQLPNLDRSVHDLAFHPCEVNGSCRQIDKGWPLTAITSMFMHGSWLHLGGNMLFLWIFGNNIEDAMGRGRFLLFYLLAGIAAVYTQTALDPSSTVPTIGASGAIAGVVGAYALLLPRAKVLTLIFIIFFVTLVEIPAYVMLGIWFVLQFLPAIGQVGTDAVSGGGVAYWAHVGGFAFGLAAIKLFANRYRPIAAGNA